MIDAYHDDDETSELERLECDAYTRPPEKHYLDFAGEAKEEFFDEEIYRHLRKEGPPPVLSANAGFDFRANLPVRTLGAPQSAASHWQGNTIDMVQTGAGTYALPQFGGPNLIG